MDRSLILAKVLDKLDDNILLGESDKFMVLTETIPPYQHESYNIQKTEAEGGSMSYMKKNGKSAILVSLLNVS